MSTPSEKLEVRIPAGANLENWIKREWDDGVQIDRMADFEVLLVQTRHSTYEITIISGSEGEVLVRGGQYFPEKTAAHLSGASLGGSFLKMRGIYVGLKVEILHNGRRIVTSPVQRIATA